MTLHNALHTGSTAHPVLSALDGRLALSGLLAVNGGSALDVRTGVMYGPGTFAVTGDSSTSPWRYTVPAATFVTSKGALDGSRIGTNDAPYLASTIAPPASNSRYDVIYAVQLDIDATISPDASTAPVIAVYNGAASATPSLATALAAIPAGAIALASALVLSTATSGTSGAGVTITQQFLWTTTRNDPTPIRNATEQAALTPYDGLTIYRLDTHTSLVYTGTRWGAPAPVLLGAADIPQTLAGTAWTDMTTVTATSLGGQVIVDWDAVAFNGSSGADRQVAWRVVCDGTQIGPASAGTQAVPLAGTPRVYAGYKARSTPAAGSHTWKLQVSASAASSVFVEFATMTVVEYP